MIIVSTLWFIWKVLTALSFWNTVNYAAFMTVPCLYQHNAVCCYSQPRSFWTWLFWIIGPYANILVIVPQRVNTTLVKMPSVSAWAFDWRGGKTCPHRHWHSEWNECKPGLIKGGEAVGKKGEYPDVSLPMCFSSFPSASEEGGSVLSAGISKLHPWRVNQQIWSGVLAGSGDAHLQPGLWTTHCSRIFWPLVPRSRNSVASREQLVS